MELQNNYNSNIKGHWPPITKYNNIINTTIIKKVQTLPKCDTETKWENAVKKNDTNRFAQCRCHKPSICKKHSIWEA